MRSHAASNLTLTASSVSAVRSADQYMIQHSDEMLDDIGEIWRTLQSGRLHSDRRVVAANLHAARIVSTLVLACTVVPELIDERFRAEHERLNNTPYLKHYRSLAESVTIRAGLLSQLPTPFLIGSRHEPGADFDTKTERLIVAKDYVAALTDARARSIFQQSTGDRAVSTV